VTTLALFTVAYAAAVATAFVLLEEWLKGRPDLTGDEDDDRVE
jgi:hypothetical protein